MAEDYFLIVFSQSNEDECREILGDTLVNAHASGCEVPEPKAKKLYSIFTD